eukprot:g5274.t1
MKMVLNNLKILNIVGVIFLWKFARLVERARVSSLNRIGLGLGDSTTLRFLANSISWLCAGYFLNAGVRRLGIFKSTDNVTSLRNIAGLSIGLASQSTLGNFVAGVILCFTRPFRVGDRIRVGQAEGWVIEIVLM